MTEHLHDWRYVSPGRRQCPCGARLAVEVKPVDKPLTLRGSDVTWADQYRPDRSPSDG